MECAEEATFPPALRDSGRQATPCRARRKERDAGARVITGNILGRNLQDVMVHVLSGPRAGAHGLPTTADDKSVETGVGELGAGLDDLAVVNNLPVLDNLAAVYDNVAGGGDANPDSGRGCPGAVGTAYVVPHVSSTATAQTRARTSGDMS